MIYLKITNKITQLTLVLFLLTLAEDLNAQPNQERFDSFDPIEANNIFIGKAYVHYETIASIPKNSGRWVVPKYPNSHDFIRFKKGGSNKSFVGRANDDKRGRGILYVHNNTDHKELDLSRLSFDYINKEVEGVVDNFTFRVWGVKDLEDDGWDNDFVLGFGGHGKFADNMVSQWDVKEDPDMVSLVNIQNVPSTNDWRTYSVSIYEDLSEYDWVFISFGHAFQKKPIASSKRDIFFGIDNVTIPEFLNEN